MNSVSVAKPHITEKSTKTTQTTFEESLFTFRYQQFDTTNWNHFFKIIICKFTMYSMKVIESTPSILRESRTAFCRGGRQARTFERMLNCVGILQPGVGDRREFFCEN